MVELENFVMKLSFIPFAKREIIKNNLNLVLKEEGGTEKILALLDCFTPLEPLRPDINKLKNEIILANLMNETLGGTEI
jgi:hypothetical protein